MSDLTTQLIELIPPVLPGGDAYCLTTLQRFAIDLFANASAVLRSDIANSFYNYGSSTPSAENRIFPWLNSTNGLWYIWSNTFGLWVSPVNPSDLVDNSAKLWIPPQGTLLNALFSLDEGDGTDPRQFLPDGSSNPAYVAPTAATGAMWMPVDSMVGRVPIGVGVIPDSDLGAGAASVGVAQPTDSFGRKGEYAHVLLQSEMPATALSVSVKGALGTDLDPATKRFLADPKSPGSGSGPLPDISIPMMPPGGGLSHNTMQPYLGVYFITHTSRKFYVLPG